MSYHRQNCLFEDFLEDCRRVAAIETVEVDLHVNTAKAHVEQQETLLRKTSSSPWFLFN